MSGLDLHTGAAELARRLSSSQLFEAAARELLECDRFSPNTFRRYSKKIVRLIEIAHTTLTRAGVALHAFTSCPPAFAQHKNAYFDLINVLRAHKHEVEPELRGRASRLLLPLYPLMVIQKRGDPLRDTSEGMYKILSKCKSRSMAQSEAVGSTSRTECQSSMEALMPAPDAFPPSRSRGRTRTRIARGRTKIRGKGLATSFDDDSRVTPCGPCGTLSQTQDSKPGAKPDDILRWLSLYTPLPRMFGIKFSGANPVQMRRRRHRPY